MKCFYLPGAPLNLTCDKASTETVLMMKPMPTDVQLYRSQQGKLWEIELCQLYSQLTCQPVKYPPHWYHHQNNKSCHHSHHIVCCAGHSISVSEPLQVFSFTNLFPFCMLLWTHDSLCTSLIQSSEVVCSFFYLSKQAIHPVYLSAFLYVLSPSRSHYKRWSPTELINPEWTPFPPSDWWVWEGGCRLTDNFLRVETY